MLTLIHSQGLTFIEGRLYRDRKSSSTVNSFQSTSYSSTLGITFLSSLCILPLQMEYFSVPGCPKNDSIYAASNQLNLDRWKKASYPYLELATQVSWTCLNRYFIGYLYLSGMWLGVAPRINTLKTCA